MAAEAILEIACAVGLDTNTPKQFAQPGSLYDCLNYEIDENGGYKLIRGMAGYDGQYDLSKMEFFYLKGNTTGGSDVDATDEGASAQAAFSSISYPVFPIKDSHVRTGVTGEEIILIPTVDRWNSVNKVGYRRAADEADLGTETSFTIGSMTFTVTEGYPFSWENVENGKIPYDAVDRYVTTLWARNVTKSGSTGTNPDIPTHTDIGDAGGDEDNIYGCFWFNDDLYAFADVDGQSYSSLYKTSVTGWQSVNLGQEMAFADGELSMEFEDYIAWDGASQTSADSLGNIFKGGTSSKDDLDYFPGQIIYWQDSTDSNAEYWATVTAVYTARGGYHGPQVTACACATDRPINDLTAARAGDVVDGYTTQNNDRVLVKNQTDARDNGIWIYTASAPTRATDFDTNLEVETGTIVPVTNGTLNRGTSWVVINFTNPDLTERDLLFARDQQAEGALTIYDVYKNGSTASSGSVPLSSTGSFGKWTEGNSVNFTSGSEEPSIGDTLADSTNTVTMTVLRVILDSGTWGGGDATGTIVCGAMSGGTSISSGDNLRNNTSTTTNVMTTANQILDSDRDDILNNTSTNVSVTLPAASNFFEDSRVTSVEHNFFATDGSSNPTAQSIPTNAVFMAGGQGFLMKWDGTHFQRIRTGAIVSQDKPRHVSVHANRLVVGYGDGTVSMSVEGQPDNFRGVDGALTFGYGAGITGLLPLNGDTTAVFTKKAVHMLQGTNDQNLVQREIADDTGAIEYTAVNMGSPLYCDRHGIATLAQTEAYGDFNRQRISQQVRSWLKPRLERFWVDPRVTFDPITSGDKDVIKPGGQVEFALPVPGKNQYRLFFRDGMVLTCTMWNALTGDVPAFTIQSSWFRRLEEIAVFNSNNVWGYGCSGIDSDGRDVQFYGNATNVVFAHRSPDYRDGSGNTGERYKGIHRLDYTPHLVGQGSYLIFNPIYDETKSFQAHMQHTLQAHGAYNGFLRTVIKVLPVYSLEGDAAIRDSLSGLFYDGGNYADGDDLKQLTTATGDHKIVKVSASTDPWYYDAHFSKQVQFPARGEAIILVIGNDFSAFPDPADTDSTLNVAGWTWANRVESNGVSDEEIGSTPPATYQKILIPTVKRLMHDN